MESAPDLDLLLRPAAIALVGASEASGWTTALRNNLAAHGFTGPVHFVNPRHRTLFGQPCHASLTAIGEPVHLAYVMTGADAAEAVIADAGTAGVRAAIVLTSDYSETGAEGAERERALVAAARQAGIVLQGPNCLGNVNYGHRVAAYALPIGGRLLSGRVAVLTQSGAMLLHLHRLAHQRGIGLSAAISSGNEAMVDAVDWIDHLLDDPDTQVVACLLEALRSPGRLLGAAQRALEMGKALVVLKIGATEAAARSAAAHTGALAAHDRIVSAVFEQAGIIRVRTPEQLVETAALIAGGRLPAGRRTVILTASGGASGLAADLAAAANLDVPDFDSPTREALKVVLPPFATPQNPLDTTGLVVLDVSLVPRALGVIAAGGAEGGAFDSALLVWDPPREPGADPARTESRLQAIAAGVLGSPLPTFLSSYVAGELPDYGQDAIRRHGVHFANGIALGLVALEGAVQLAEARRRLLGRRPPAVRPRPPLELPERPVLTEAESLRLLAHYGVPTPPLLVARSAEEAVRMAGEVGYPAVLKVQSPDLPHKTEVGGVRLNLLSGEEVAAAYGDLLEVVAASVPGARLEGLLVARQVFPVAELFAGVIVDQHFGPIVVCGMGGIFVEVLDDVAMRRCPINFDEAVGMLRELRGHPLLEGARGLPRADVHAAATSLVRLSELGAERADQLAAVDVNPLLLLSDGEGALAGDALVMLR